jgi:hypothetical protein
MAAIEKFLTENIVGRCLLSSFVAIVTVAILFGIKALLGW